MFKKIIFIQVFLFGIVIINAQQKLFSLKVEVDNLKNSNGRVQFALYNKENSIPDEKYHNTYKILTSEIKNGESTVTFTNLPEGTYAVNILHDENKDGKINKGLLLPIEGIGFSNYQKIGLGNKPNFQKASFLLNKNSSIKVKIIYF